jgi:hypothetical protein
LNWLRSWFDDDADMFLEHLVFRTLSLDGGEQAWSGTLNYAKLLLLPDTGRQKKYSRSLLDVKIPMGRSSTESTGSLSVFGFGISGLFRPLVLRPSDFDKPALFSPT